MSASFDYADVVSVKPVVENYPVEVPREECWIERQPVSPAKPMSITPEIVGAILGGAMGYQFGDGSGQDVATVVGALLGGSIGHDMKVRKTGVHGKGSGVYQNVQRCQMVSEINTEERIVAYNVAYRYNGKLYTTTMDRDPGERVRVAISVDVVE